MSNFSERYTAKLSNTTPAGNSVNVVAESVRKFGVVPENILPFDDTIDTWEKFYAPIPEQIVLLGKNWLNFYDFGYEWVFTPSSGNKQTKLKEALKYSPVGISVFAWQWDENNICYKEKGAPDNHWCLCYGYYCEGPQSSWFWKVFDTYDNTFKKLAWDYDFGWGMRYSLWKKVQTDASKKNIIENAIAVLNSIKNKLIEISAQIKGRLKGYWQQIIQ